MKRLNALAFAGALAVASVPTSASAFSATCMCEHFGSQYDGLCEAYPQTGVERYYWSTWGAAYFPYPVDESSGFAYYDVWPHGYAGGLIVTIADPSTGQQSSTPCGGWTGGG